MFRPQLASRLAIFAILLAALIELGHSTGCQNGVNGCLTCADSIKCQNCTVGTYLNSIYECSACPVGCTTCTSAINCTSCKGDGANFVMFNNLCTCRSRFGVEPISITCISCLSDNCTNCANDYRYCANCASPFGPNQTLGCSPCSVTNCSFCSIDYRVCAGCIVGYGVGSTTSQCIPCIDPNCTFCQGNASRCRNCVLTTGIASNYSCVSCSDLNCRNCSDNMFKCSECYPPYKNVGTVCVNCTVENCTRCTRNISLCQECVQGYGVSALSDSCLKCQDTRCASCSANYTKCKSCKTTQAYGVNETSFTCVPCVNTTCSACPDNYTYCTACKSGYVPNTGICRPCQEQRPNCVVCAINPPACSMCAQGYGKDNNYCTKCTDTNCMRCQANPNICQYCKDGFGAQNNRCVDCSLGAHCLSCANADAKYCIACSDGYGVNKGICSPCNKTNCSTCSKNYAVCDVCVSGYGLKSGDCIQCTNANCIDCNANNSVCVRCRVGFRITGIVCEDCVDGNCDICPNTASVCERCIIGYGVSPSSSCQVCLDPRCTSCSLNSSICTNCSVGYGVSASSTCQVCLDSRCTSCSLNSSLCTQCSSNYGVNDNNQCQVCSQNSCVLCPFSINQCTQCQKGYFLNSGICSKCSDPYCLNCSSNPSICTQCINDTLHGLNQNVCSLCQSSCLTCSHTDYAQCTSCQTSKYLSVQNKCVQCLSNCLQCSNGTVCDVCADGFYLSNDGICHICPTHCTLCQFNSEYSLPQCTQCQNNYFFINSNISPPICAQICGDNYALTYQCDNQIGVEYDGCDDNCQIMTDFNCIVNESKNTFCSYFGMFQIIPNNISTNSSNQQLNISVNIIPHLSIFDKMTDSDLNSLFSFDNTAIQIQNIKYSNNSHIFTLETKVNSNVSIMIVNMMMDVSHNSKSEYFSDQKVQANLNINYVIPQKQNETQNKTEPQTQNKTEQTIPPIIPSTQQNITLPQQRPFISKFVEEAPKVLHSSSYAISTVSWGTVVAGLVFKKLGGIEAIFVTQFSFISVFSSDQSLLPLKSLQPLKYATGLNFHSNSASTTNSSTNNSKRLLQQAEQTVNQFFSNNFNFSFIILAIPLIFVIITYIRLRLFFRSNPHIRFTHQETETEEQSHLLRLTKHYSVSLQFLMYCTLFNLTYFFACSGMFFIADGIKDAMSIIMLLIGTVFFVAVFVQFYRIPQSFGFFCFSFKEQKLAKYHYFIYTVVLITIILLMTLLPSLPYLSLIPCSAMFIFTLLTHPYRETKENYRSAFNLLVMISFIIFKVYLTYCAPENINGPTTYALAILNILILLPIVIILSLVSTVYYWYNENYVKPKEDENYEKEQQEIQRERLETVLEKMGLLRDEQPTMNKISNDNEHNENNDHITTFTSTLNSFKGKNQYGHSRSYAGTKTPNTRTKKQTQRKQQNKSDIIELEGSLKQLTDEKPGNKTQLQKMRYLQSCKQNKSTIKLQRDGHKGQKTPRKKKPTNDKANDKFKYQQGHLMQIEKPNNNDPN